MPEPTTTHARAARGSAGPRDDPGDVPLWDARRDLGAFDGESPRGSAAHDMVVALDEVRARADREQPVPPLRMAPALGVLDAVAEPVLRRRAETAVACLELLVRAYPSDGELQEFLAVPPAMHRWILRDAGPSTSRVHLCRIDLLGASLGTVRTLEFNASSPGAVLTAGRLNRYWRRSSFGRRLEEWGVPATRTEEPDWFADWLLAHGRARGVAEPDLHRVGVFFDRFTEGSDLVQIRGQLARRGRETEQLHPEDYDPADGVRLGYLKHIAQDAHEIEGWERFCAAVTAGELVIPNDLAERWVAENKLCMAALSDPRFRRFFDADQRRALDALVPYSRKLGDGISVAEAERGRCRLVLKAPYGARGLSVVVGVDTDEDTWSAAVRDPAHRGWLLQERVVPPGLRPGARAHRDLVVGLVDGAVAVYGSRINEGDLLNLTQGGAEQSVFAPHPLPGA